MLASWLMFIIIAWIVIRPRQAYDLGWQSINTVATAIGRALPRAPAIHNANANGAGLGPRIGTEAPPPAR